MKQRYWKTKGGVYVYAGTQQRRGLRCPGEVPDGKCGEQLTQARLDPRKVRILDSEVLRLRRYGVPRTEYKTAIYCVGCLTTWTSRSRWVGDMVQSIKYHEPKSVLFQELRA